MLPHTFIIHTCCQWIGQPDTTQRENIPQPEEESRLIKSRVNCNNCNVYCKDIIVFIMQCRKSKRGASNPLR